MSNQPPKSNTLPYILAGTAIVLVMFGGLGTWAAITPLSGAVIAPGVVTVYSMRKTVQHLEGGIVAEILVRDGDLVEKGQLLVRLDDTRVRSNLGILNGQLDVLRAREARLKAERDGLARVEFPALLAERRKSPGAADIMRGESAFFAARDVTLRGEIEILTKRISQLKEQVTGLRAQRRANQRQVGMIRQELTGVRQLYEKGYASKTRVLNLERSVEALKGENGGLIAEIARARSSVGETELQIIQLHKVFRQEVIEELRDVQAAIFDLRERRTAAADEARRIEITAPQSGAVFGLDVHTLGGVINPGQPILDIVPVTDELVVEARVAPYDIDKIQPGLLSTVRFSAFNMRSTPELVGTIAVTSADRLRDDASGQPYYLVRVRIAKEELSKLGNLKLVPGMPAEVFVNTGERTALSYLMKPLTDSLSRSFKDG